jgi:lysophospholipase L1-like esterase
MARPAPHHRARHFGALFFVLAALAAATVAPAAAGAQTAPPASYVALGDSYTSGPLIPNQSLSPLGCLRSDRNYPHLVAPSAGQPAFRDVSCSGADTNDMFSEQGVTPGPNPPQLNALDANTRLVTLGIGGNDIGFSGIIEDCATLWPFGTPCRDRFVSGGVDQLSGRIAATAPKVAAVLDAIRARSPQARILVVGYPAILPDTGSGCWPSMPIAYSDVGYLRAKTKELNSMLATQAAARGATFVDTYTPSIGHDVCKSTSVRWVEPIIPGNTAAPVHPNARGMAGMAAAVVARL